MNWEGFFPRFWEESAFLKLVKFGGRKTNYFRSVVFPTPKPPTFPCTTKGLAALWTLAGEFVLVAGDFGSRVWTRYWKRLWRAFLLVACVTGLDVRHGCTSVPCLDYVTGIDVRHGCASVLCLDCVFEIDNLYFFMEIFL